MNQVQDSFQDHIVHKVIKNHALGLLQNELGVWNNLSFKYKLKILDFVSGLWKMRSFSFSRISF